MEDSDFALEYGLLPSSKKKGGLANHFIVLADYAGIKESLKNDILRQLTSKSDVVKILIEQPFLDDCTKRNYLQAFQTRVSKVCGWVSIY